MPPDTATNDPNARHDGWLTLRRFLPYLWPRDNPALRRRIVIASVLILLARFGLKLILTPLACAGRMAFTNYLTQTLIMTTIFYGGRGLGWYGQIGWPEMWMVIGGVWAAQLIWSPLWLSVFSMGPLEWGWRCLTYKRMVPLRRA
jgi:uncharacterized protein